MGKTADSVNQSNINGYLSKEKPSFRSYLYRSYVKAVNFAIRNKNLESVRSLWDSSAKRAKISKNFVVKQVTIEGVNCEWISTASSSQDKVLIYLHGGGYVLGSLNTARGFAMLLCRTSGFKVLSVDYRLAPENKFPAALEDSLKVYNFLLSSGVLAQNIAVVGDSAGGGLSLSTVLSLKDKFLPLPAAVVCFSPWADLAGTGESYKLNSKLDPLFGRGGGVISSLDYAEEHELRNPYVSPAYGEYTNFPPLLIHVGTDEIILDDSLTVVRAAEAAGAHVELKIWNRMWHVFTAHGHKLPEASQSLKEVGEFLRAHIK